MNIRMITIHDFKSKVHAIWLILIGRACGVGEVIPDDKFYKTALEEWKKSKTIQI